MSLRRSKGYAGFKALNGLLFFVFGAAILVQIVRAAGVHFDAIPGVILGLAMMGLGLHRTVLLVRARR